MAMSDSHSKLKLLPARKDSMGACMQQRCLLEAFACDDFRMFEFKIRQCMRGRSHDWTDCPFAHPGEKARRRDPRKFHYSGSPCPDFRKGNCKRGDLCEYAHGVFECWLHPARYRTQVCKDGELCKRRVCFFAHSSQQLRHLQETSMDIEFPAAEALAIENDGEFSDKAGMSSGSACNATNKQVENASRPVPVRKLPSHVCSSSTVSMNSGLTVNLDSEIISALEYPYNSFSMTVTSPCDAIQSRAECHTSCLVEQQAMGFPSFILHEGCHGGSPCYDVGGPSLSPKTFQMDSSREMNDQFSKCTFARGLNVPLGLPSPTSTSTSPPCFYSSPSCSPCISTLKNGETYSFFADYPWDLHSDVTTPKKSTMVTYQSCFREECFSPPHENYLYIQGNRTNLGSSSHFPCTSWENGWNLAHGSPDSPTDLFRVSRQGPEFVDISSTMLDCRYDLLSKSHGGIESTFESTLVPDVGWVHELVM